MWVSLTNMMTKIKLGKESGNHKVSKVEAPILVQQLLDAPKPKLKVDYSTEKGIVDYYGVLARVGKELFQSKDNFELNISNYPHQLAKEVGVEKPENLDYRTSAYGGVGSAESVEYINDITFVVDFGINTNRTAYVGLFRDIAENNKYKVGVYEITHPSIFEDILVEQLTKAHNRLK